MHRRTKTFTLIKTTERDEGGAIVGIDGQRSLVALRCVPYPLRITLLTLAQDVPRLGMVGLELHGLLEQNDRAVVVADDAELFGFGKVLFGDGPLGDALLQLLGAAAARSLVEQLVVCLASNVVLQDADSFV